MKQQILIKYISVARFGRYKQATKNDIKRAEKLYKANLRLAQAFHPLLGILEVTLRNTLNNNLCVFFNDVDWILNRQNFMNSYLKGEIQKAQNRLNRNKAVVTSSKIIAEQTLGFWTNFFEKSIYKNLKGNPIQIFNKLPSGIGRLEIHNKLDSIRLLRNRINHNEPICFRGNQIDLKEAQEIYTNISEIMTWINPDLFKWMKEVDKVEKEIIRILKI
jgi:Abi-like protein